MASKIKIIIDEKEYTLNEIEDLKFELERVLVEYPFNPIYLPWRPDEPFWEYLPHVVGYKGSLNG